MRNALILPTILSQHLFKGLAVHRISVPWLLCVLLVFGFSAVQAQTVEASKPHFRIHGTATPEIIRGLEQALDSYGLLDAYRLENSRRMVEVEGSAVRVELYSLQELGKTGRQREALKHAPFRDVPIVFACNKNTLKVIRKN